MGNWRHILVVLISVLMIAPVDARAHQFGLGLGYVDGDCGVLAETESTRCFRGARWELLWNFYGSRPNSGIESGDGEVRATSARGNSSVSWFHHTNFGSFGGGGRSDSFVLIFLAALLLVAGLFWAIVFLFSTRTKLGIYYSSDLQEMPIIADGNQEGIESYRVDKLGSQVSFYPASSFDFQLYFGLAGASARVRTIEDDGSTASYNLSGFASKAGLGYMPDMGTSGPMLLAEVEGAFYGDSAIRYSQKARKKLVPKYRSNAALMIGYSVSW